MTKERFTELVHELRDMSFETLLTKNSRYGNEDALHNFHRGAEIMGCTAAQAALGYMTKHLAALIKMVQTNNFNDLDDVAEKCQDIVNYTIFIWCCANEWQDAMREVGIE
jgi:hypothetical protein